MKSHKIFLEGATKGGLRVPASVLRGLLAALEEGVRQATRFAIDGESTKKGPMPKWLDDAWESVDFLGLEPGSVAISFEAKPLEEVVPDIGNQLAMFDVSQISRKTPFELFATVLSDSITKPQEEISADRPLLETCLRFSKSIQPHYSHMRISVDGRKESTFVVGKNELQRIETIKENSPEPRAVRVCGLLDEISATKPDAWILMADGSRIRVHLSSLDKERLRTLFGARVALTGVGKFKPSGQISLISTDHLEEAVDADEVFSCSTAIASQQLLLRPPKKESALSDSFGAWPGDESLEELIERLREIRR